MLIIPRIPSDFLETLSCISQILSTQDVQVFPILNEKQLIFVLTDPI